MLCALAALALIAVPAGNAATGGAAPPGGGRATVCGPTPGTLSVGSFTMLIRIQRTSDVKTYTNHDEATGGLGGRIQPQDIFVINTRDQLASLTPDQRVAEFGTSVTSLRAAFPCNRIIALNGLSYNSLAPGYRYALAGLGPWAMMLDWEPSDWSTAQATAPLPPFTYLFPKTLKRMKWTALTLGATNAATANDAGTRAGMVPIDQSDWDYGQIAKAMDAGSRHTGGAHNGVQSVMTQENCRGGAAPFAARLAAIRDQYKFRTQIKKVKRRRHGKIVRVKIMKKVKIKKAKRSNLLNLAAQISFNTTPIPGDPLPIKAIGPTTADQCVAAGLSTGVTAFFFFASAESMQALYQQPTVASLRPFLG
ncbi:MAG: hypothetical protein ACXWEA_00685 [Solirubrobacterales bacterium]